MSKKSVQGKVIIITGASSGIGKALAAQCAEQGASVVLVARRKPLLDSLAAEIQEKGGKALAVKADMSKEADVKRMVAATIKRFKKVDVLVNNAGSGLFGKIEKCTTKDMEDIFNANFFSTHLACLAVIPHMQKQKQGHIINLGSMFVFTSGPLYAGYASAKSAVRAYSDALRLELNPHNIEVSMVYPGSVDSGFHASVKNLEGTLPGKKKASSKKSLKQKLVQFILPSTATTAEQAGKQILDCIKKPRRSVFPDRFIRFVLLSQQLFPEYWDRKIIKSRQKQGLL